jgi:hypothetical protein
LIWEVEGRRAELVEELGEASRRLTVAAVLVALAAFILAMLPLAVVLGAPRQDWLGPALTSLAAILTGTKVVAAVWGILRGAF